MPLLSGYPGVPQWHKSIYKLFSYSCEAIELRVATASWFDVMMCVRHQTTPYYP